MTWLWISGIVGFLIVLLCITRIGAWVKFGSDDLTVDVRFGVFRIHILPAKKKEKTPKQKAAEEQKAAEAAKKREAQKAAKKAAREARKQAQKGEKFSVKTERLKAVLTDVQGAVDALWPPLKRALNRTRKGIRIHPLQLSLTVGGQTDPAAGAQLYGYLHAGVWTVMPALEQVLDIPEPYIHVGVDFDSPDTRAEGEAGITLRIGTLLAVGASVAFPALRWFLKWNKKKKQAQKQQDALPAASDTNKKG